MRKLLLRFLFKKDEAYLIFHALDDRIEKLNKERVMNKILDSYNISCDITDLKRLRKDFNYGMK